jgi:hypothetical protein
MNPSLRDLQRRFAASLLGGATDLRTGVYASTVRTNYRNALAATYPVVRELTGVPFFNAAVDAFTIDHPSTGGDLNVYGGALADFLAAYAYAVDLPYLPDVARLEWAVDEATRAQDSTSSAEALLAALGRVPADAVTRQRFLLDRSCRLLRSNFPVMRIWQVHQGTGERIVDLDAGADHLLVRREADVPAIARIAPAEWAFLGALLDGLDLASALDTALAVDGEFDLALALRTRIADGTIAGIA